MDNNFYLKKQTTNIRDISLKTPYKEQLKQIHKLSWLEEKKKH